MSLTKKFDDQIKQKLIRRLKVAEKRMAYIKTVKRMHKLVRKALKQIKPNVNVKSLVYKVKGQLRKIAGGNKEMKIKSRKMFNKFNMKAQRKVRKIVRRLQLNIAKKGLNNSQQAIWNDFTIYAKKNLFRWI